MKKDFFLLAALAAGFALGAYYLVSTVFTSPAEPAADEIAAHLPPLETPAASEPPSSPPPEIHSPQTNQPPSIEAPEKAARPSRLENARGAQFEDVSIENIAAKLAEIESQPDSPQKNHQRSELFKRWGKLDGEGAFIAAHAYDSQTASQLISAAAEGWAATEPVAAWEALMQASNHGALQNIRLGPALREIANGDMGQALSLLSSIKSSFAQDRTFHDLLNGNQSNEKFQAVFAGAAALEDPTLKSRLSNLLFQRWSHFDIEGATAGLGQIGDADLASAANQGLLSGWARRDGAAAYDYAAQLGTDPKSVETLAAVAKSWLRTANATEANDIIDRIAAHPSAPSLVSALSFELAAANPQRALELAAQIENPRDRSMTVSKTIARWASNDPEAAEAYVYSMADDNQKAGQLPNLMMARLRKGQDLAPIADMIQTIENSAARNRIVSFAKSRISSASPSEAASIQAMLDQVPGSSEITVSPKNGSTVIIRQ